MSRLRLALAASLVLLALGATPAAAGTYTVSSCRTPDGGVAGTDGWIAGGRQAFADFCGGAERLFGLYSGAQTGGEGGDSGAYDFAAPADTRIAGYTLWRSTQVSTKSTNPQGQPPDTWATVIFEYDEQIDFERYTDLCYGFQGCSGRGDVKTPLAEANKVSRPSLPANTRHIQFVAGCSFRGTQCQPDNPQANFQVHRSDIVLEDLKAPTIGGPIGGGLGGGPGVVTGPSTATFTARDTGGGIEKAILEVDGRDVAEQAVDDNGGACRRPFTRRVPCKLDVSGAIGYDLTQLADGPHSVRVVIVDAGGNRRASAPATVTSRNPTTACGPDGGAPRVEAAFANGKRTQRSRFTRGTTVSGRLVDAAGQPIPNAPLRLLGRDDRLGAPIAARDDVVTGPDGRFTTGIGPGPSRRLRVAYRNGAEPALRCSAQLRISVPAPVSVSLSKRKLRAPGRVVVRGRLSQGPVPSTGKLVDLQAYDRGKWRTFATTRSAQDGRFRASLRFGKRARRGNYPIRARVRREATYPFALGYSKPVKLKLRGR